ncbi:MAG: hypothetical protein ACI83O_000424 [Patescibacteria group bacterium]|jgi:hypothetical protein
MNVKYIAYPLLALSAVPLLEEIPRGNQGSDYAAIKVKFQEDRRYITVLPSSFDSNGIQRETLSLDDKIIWENPIKFEQADGKVVYPNKIMHNQSNPKTRIEVSEGSHEISYQTVDTRGNCNEVKLYIEK